ncbi:MAG: hypothetical protein H7A23_03290 [Leptospiraceae bacterium]|nr:hypothetical protein [Leptospiraceae bacterium]MCP5493554.1 hypothetical protein [Leptospiraceae bacterium]
MMKLISVLLIALFLINPIIAEEEKEESPDSENKIKYGALFGGFYFAGYANWEKQYKQGYVEDRNTYRGHRNLFTYYLVHYYSQNNMLGIVQFYYLGFLSNREINKYKNNMNNENYAIGIYSTFSIYFFYKFISSVYNHKPSEEESDSFINVWMNPNQGYGFSYTIRF